MNDISVFSTDTSNAITFSTKADIAKFGAEAPKQHLTVEAALFKGGQALNALKDHVLQVAGNKAANGRYRPAAEIIAVAFPKQHKAFVGFLNCEPWANASKMCLFLEKCEAADVPAKGWSAKQHGARALMAAMREAIPALKNDAPHTIEA